MSTKTLKLLSITLGIGLAFLAARGNGLTTLEEEELERLRQTPGSPLYPPENDTDPANEMNFMSLKLHHEDSDRKRSVYVDEPIIVPLGSSQSINLYGARRFVLRNLNPNKANFLLYPYNFSYNNENQVFDWDYTGAEDENATVTFPEGALISTMEQESYPDFNSSDYFYWLNTTQMKISKGKPIYDVNIAVLQVQVERETGSIDLTYESDSFCTMFYSWVSGKYTRCFTSLKDYDEYVAGKPTESGNPTFSYVTPDDINSGRIFSTTTKKPRFGVLFIPDIIVGEEGTIAKMLNETGVSNLQKYLRTYGGMISTSGKGVLVLQELGFIAENTFSKRYTLKTSPSSNGWALVDGCHPSDNTGSTSEEDEFVKRTLCFSPLAGTETLYQTKLLSAPMLEKEEAGSGATIAGMRPIAWYKTDISWRRILKHDENTGLDCDLDLETQPRSYPMILYKRDGKGQIVVNLGNPSFSFSTAQWMYNSFFLAGVRPLALDNEVIGGVNGTIPALERVSLSVKLSLTNYFTEDITGDIAINIYVRNGTSVKETGSKKCQESTEVTAGELPAGGLTTEKKFVCTLTGGISKLTRKEWSFSVEIVDPLVTQDKEDVVLLWPHVKYTDNTRGSEHIISYPATIGAASAGYLRADMNIDPSSTYPHHSTGAYVDNVMNCENKEDTPALDAVHHSIVPLITPVIDIMDQIHMANYMEFDKDYYEQATNGLMRYSYPYKKGTGDDRDFDLLDWDLLHNRSDSLAANWDEAAKINKVHRSEYPELGDAKDINIGSILNANYQTTNDNPQFVLKQSNFADADTYYEHATQRMMAFLDVNDPNAARTFYGGDVPAADAQKTYPDRGKRRVLFWRHDIFFWPRYPLPLGITDYNTIISVDRYDNIKCGEGTGATVKGAFGNDVGGLIPRQGTNEIFQWNCSAPILNEATIEAATGGKIKLMNYIVPVEESDGVEAEDFIGFNSNGELEGYEDLVKFVKILRAKVDVSPEVSRLGGLMEIKFTYAPWTEGIAAAIAAGRVTVAADQISVYEIYASTTDANTLYIRFKRGSMPNEAYGRASHLQLVLDTPTGVTADSLEATMNVYNLAYDISKPETNYEDWTQRTVTNQKITFNRMGGFRMPALKMTFRTTNEAATDSSKSFFGSYELREPFVRYGIYEQELLKHRSIHGSAEFHPINDPCLVTKGSGFSAVTHIGTSSVPFREYVATGTSLLIPAAPETGRIEWSDIWGRRWVQNVRSTIFEYPPIPPPLRNFVMTTTYEILRGSERLLRWRSKDTVDVRVQMKLLNNYPKWFEITNCKANEIIQKCGDSSKTCGVTRIFDVDLDRVAQITSESDLNSKDLWVTQGHTANYGKCFRDPEVFLSGNKLTEEQRNQIQEVVLCAALVGTGKECQNLPEGLSTLTHRTDNTNNNTWNFAQQVKDYWPETYIKENMWDLTHYDYDDNWYDKAYKYHMDNNLPQLGSGWSRPQNTIVFPLYKGLGYSMTYDKTHTNPRFPGKAGWWSDNLQNRDRTLVAGQAKSNDVSVGQDSLIPEEDWVDITELRGGDVMDKSVKNALKNVYTCRFNRRRVRIDPKSPRGFHLKNVFENNIVPIPHDFDWQMEFNYDCSDGVRYSPDNISQFDNFVKTETARDWLYFAANLRGGALEDINVLATLAPLSTSAVRFEGIAKVQDGGRFTYWNPANSINSYLIVDNPVSTVLAVRNDIESTHELIPTYATTYDAVLFHHITISDPAEVGREWELSTYNNQYGFGDFSVSVFVGDAGTSCKLQPGGTRARVKFTFNNNAGFDIDLLGNAIEAIELESKPIRSDDLLKGIVSAIRQPTKYNFLNITVPPEIKDYITLTPSEDVVGVAGLFFDFDSINVASIRDGWKGDYYLDLKVSKDFPDYLRGQMFELPVSLVPEYFSTLPGDPERDPVGRKLHDYTVEVPPILFGVPYSSDAGEKLAGKVFYTSGYATNVSLRLQVDAAFALGEAYILPNGEEDVYPFRKCLGGSTDFGDSKTQGEFNCLEKCWNDLKQRATLVNYTLLRGTREASANSSEDHYVDFAEGFRQVIPSLPTPVPDSPGRSHIPDIAEYHILFRTDAPQLKSGWPLATKERTVKYIDDFGTSEAVHDWSWVNVHAKGAYLTMDWSVKLISESGENVVLDDFQPGYEGTAEITITVTNTGDYYAYGVNFTLDLENDIITAIPGIEGVPPEAVLPLHENCSAKKNNITNGISLTCTVADTLIPMSPHSFVFRVVFGPDPRESAGPKAASPLNLRVFATRAKGSLELTATRGEKVVTQDILGPFGIKYADGPAYAAALTGKEKSGTKVTLAVSHNVENARVYTYKAKLPKSKVWTVLKQTQSNTYKVDVEDVYKNTLGGSGSNPKVHFVCVLTRYTGNITTALAETNVYKWEKASGNLFFLFLLLPAVAIPAAIASAIFFKTKGTVAKPDEELGLGNKEEFVPQEYEPEPEPDEGPAAIPMKMAADFEPEYTVAQPQISEGAMRSNGYILPQGPTYVFGGKPVNVVDNV